MGLIAFLYGKLSRPGKIKYTGGNIYDLKIIDIEGNEIDFGAYSGKNLLIVNTASRCAYTPQYSDLEKLHRTYGNNVRVLGFPSNDFLWQEPGSDEEINSFCQKNYGITFKMFSKISVKGKAQHMLYQWLQFKTSKSPTWNFCKYFVSKDGRKVKFYGPNVNPLDPDIVDEISKNSR